MSHFNTYTPSPLLSAGLRTLPEWIAKYGVRFRVLGEVRLPADPDALADTLERNEAAFVRERQDDVELTARRERTLSDTQVFASATVARVRYTTQGDENAAAVRRNVLNIAPSSIRTIPLAIKTLHYMASGIEKHRDLFSGPEDADAQLAHIEALHKRITECQRDEGRETQETRLARQTRDTTKAQVLDALERTELAAVALSYVDPEPLLALRAIFDKLLPPTRTTSATVDDELELDAEVDAASTTTADDDANLDG